MSTMEWIKSKLNIDLDAIVPQDKTFQDKYVIGTRLLLLMKSERIKSGDQSYIAFLEMYEALGQTTLLDFDRANILYQAAQASGYLEGCSAECGVYRGGGSVLIAKLFPTRRHYALDTYEGFPDVFSTIDVHKKDGFADVSTTEIEQLFKAYANITMLKGPFSGSFPMIQEQAFAFVHVDADLYLSTKECLEFFYPRILPGGIMLFDDYLIPDTPGVKQAVDEFFTSKKEHPIVLPTFQAMVFKA
jgi:O-methyltransferase